MLCWQSLATRPVSFPDRAVSHDESLAVLDDIYAGSNAADEHLPALAAQLGVEIACHKGCPGKCCESLVLISAPEGLRIANELKKPERRETRERFVARMKKWSERSGDGARGAPTLCRPVTSPAT